MRPYFFLFFILNKLYAQNHSNHTQKNTPVITGDYQTTQRLTNNVIWRGTSKTMRLQDVAAYAAPVLWFSPDEPNLGNDHQKGISIPEAFPFEKASTKPVVYYKIPNIIVKEKKDKNEAFNADGVSKDASIINLEKTTVFYIDYYFYYASETGLGSHPHDIESAIMKIIVHKDDKAREYSLQVAETIGRAHGLYWYNNVHTSDYFTKFPMTVLIEEGKHASCPDANGDGLYTPGFDVNKRTNDAWGIRDIIRSGILYSGSYQDWMCKSRDTSTIVSPPLPYNSPLYDVFSNDKRKLQNKPTYELRPFPDTNYTTTDKHLNKLIKDKKPVLWPEINYSAADQKYIHGIPEDKELKSFAVAYRKDAGDNFVVYTPLLLFKNVSAPMTGGWFVNKFYFGTGDLIFQQQQNGKVFSSYDNTIFGHMITHVGSASRWIDTYFGAGYEINDTNPDKGKTNYKLDFAAEYGLKIRVNLKLKPLFKNPKFIGIRIGYKVTGFYPTTQSGLIFELGAGLW